jgi:6-phosphogluconolactonase (cycloisomerase 2 family)
MKSVVALQAIVLALGLTQAGSAADGGGAGPESAHSKSAVFVMTNAAHHNEILSFERQSDGSLKKYGTFHTGGRGSGGTTDPLGSQGSLTLSDDHTLLFAVNAGSGEISSFLVDGPKLLLVDVKPSGGSAPVAVAQHGSLLYALNFAGDSSVVGFTIDDGSLKEIPGSIRYLTAANSGASSLAFSNDGSFLVVTEKLTNKFDVFPVKSDGTLGAAVVTQDASAGLFAVAFAPNGALLAVETGGSTISSYWVEASGVLTGLSIGVPTLGAGTCWHAITPNGDWVYTSNSATSTISGFSIAAAGALTPLTGTIVATNPAGTTNLDVAISGDGKFLYSLNEGNGTIGVFGIGDNGKLTPLGELPAFAAKTGFNGIAAL